MSWKVYAEIYTSFLRRYQSDICSRWEVFRKKKINTLQQQQNILNFIWPSYVRV